MLKTGAVVDATLIAAPRSIRNSTRKRRALDRQTPWAKLLDQAEQLKASVRAKVEHPFQVIKCPFDFTKVRSKGLARNTAQLVTRFALSNLWMARRDLMGMRG